MIPPWFATCDARGHDPGDEDPRVADERQLIKADRQAWKAEGFHWRMYARGMAAPR